MENAEKNQNGAMSDMAAEKKTPQIVLGMPRGCGSEAEGRTPVVIHGSGNNITIIERQYNDRTASETVKAMLEADKANADMVKDVVGKIIEVGATFIPRMAPTESDATKEPEMKRENPRPRRAAKKAPVKKAAKKAPAKKVVKKSAAKKSISKNRK